MTTTDTERAELVARHRGLVYEVARGLRHHPLAGRLGGEEDLIQTLYEGLLDAIRRFDPAGPWQFSTVAYRRMRFVFLLRARRSGLVRVPAVRSPLAETRRQAERAIDCYELLPPAADRGGRRRGPGAGRPTAREGELADAVGRAVAAVPGERDREAVRRYHGLGRPRETMAAIARDWGVSRERVRQVLLRAHARLRAALRHLAPAA